MTETYRLAPRSRPHTHRVLRFGIEHRFCTECRPAAETDAVCTERLCAREWTSCCGRTLPVWEVTSK